MEKGIFVSTLIVALYERCFLCPCCGTCTVNTILPDEYCKRAGGPIISTIVTSHFEGGRLARNFKKFLDENDI
jgi:hypothetical protein